MQEFAEMVMPSGAEKVLNQLLDVEAWPRFIEGLEDVAPVSHQRYLFAVTVGGRREERLMAVVPNLHQRRVPWKVIDGPAWNGQFTLSPMDDHRTVVRLARRVDPVGLMDTLGEAFGSDPNRPQHDLTRLHGVLAARGRGGIQRVSPVTPTQTAPVASEVASPDPVMW